MGTGLAVRSDLIDDGAPRAESGSLGLGVARWEEDALKASGWFRSASRRLYAICLFLSPLSRLKMIARMSGKYMFSVSVEGSSPSARSSMTRRSFGTESRSLSVRWGGHSTVHLRRRYANLAECRHAELEAIP